MQRAKAMGIDAFALNIGTDSYTDRQLGFAYQSAANNGMQVFISFDFAWWSTSSATAVGQKIAAYASKPAQFKIANKVFASSFLGDGLDVAAMRKAAGVDVYWLPNYFPGQSDVSKIDGALSWMVRYLSQRFLGSSMLTSPGLAQQWRKPSSDRRRKLLRRVRRRPVHPMAERQALHSP
jgi:hypothetical protein